LKNSFIPALAVLLMACSPKYDKTVTYVERDRFMGKWYVMAGRFTSAEEGAVNPVETYTWNEKEKRIDIDFRFNQGGPEGELKKYPQKAWITNKDNAHWEVQPFWPLKFDYLILSLDTSYQWTAIGVPNQKYLWIMSRKPSLGRVAIDQILMNLKKKGYDTSGIVYVDHYE
jgi:apolipoprotein D and lipocalin family protein